MASSPSTIVLDHENNSIEIVVRKSLRAKRLSIRISGHKGVELIIPKRVSMKYALEYLDSKKDWVIEKSRKNSPVEKIKFTPGNTIPVLGKVYEIKYSGNIRGVTHIESNAIIVSGYEEYIPKKVQRFLKDLMRKEVIARVDIDSAKLRVKYRKVTLRDTVTRWGSCSSNGNLSFSWRLVFAPREVMEYVVAHEVSHLVHMNHSPDFWQVVESICPNQHSAKTWLKENGSSLHYYE